MKKFGLDKYIIIYYVIIFCFMVLLCSASEPSMVMRLLFLAMTFIPLIKFNYLMPSVIICALALLTITDTVVFMPLPYTDSYYYAVVLLVLFISVKDKISIDGVLLFVLFFIYIYFVDLITGSQVTGMRQNIPMLLLIGLFCSKLRAHETLIPILLNTFCLISVLASLLFFIKYQEFLVDYNSMGLERSGWNDPNYFSCAIGMGGIIAMIQLMRKESKNGMVILFWSATLVLSIISQVLLASRGGLLATVCAFLIMLRYLKVSIKYKVLSAILAGILVVFLYNNGFFELLEYRIVNDTSEGSSRIMIWTKKLDTFFQSNNPLKLLFGYGYEGGLLLGNFGRLQGSHNDFIAMLTEYGLIGLVFFIYLLIRPFKEAASYNKDIILTLLIYLVVICFTLEPLTLGNFVYLGFYLTIVVVSKTEVPKKIVDNI